jgi:hypothetical protein
VINRSTRFVEIATIKCKIGICKGINRTPSIHHCSRDLEKWVIEFDRLETSLSHVVHMDQAEKEIAMFLGDRVL